MFLGSFSSTFNVLMSIPTSLIGTLAVMYFLGFTINTFTLLAISLSVGIVVDDAIMVMENIYRHGEMGKDRVRASTDGATRSPSRRSWRPARSWRSSCRSPS
jgi:multidrug efflux pump subunit AcrB